MDQYLAIAYFQTGVSNFLIGDFEEALANFNDTLLYLRGNSYIDYEQLGLKYKLHSCEALFNRGLCYVYLQAADTGLQDMIHATREKANEDHNVIDEAIKDRAEGYTVFSIPVGTVFRPSDAKVKNVRARDYLGKTQVRLVASEQHQQQPTTSQHRRNVSADTWSKSDRAPHELSFAASNLVKPNLVSRSRQQSEPPIHRNVFPPTPPPENEKPMYSRPNAQRQQPSLDTGNIAKVSPNSASQTRSAPPVDAPRPPRSHSATRLNRPEKLELGVAAFEQPLSHGQEPPRRGAVRSASERPPERRRDEYDRERIRYKPSRERLFGSVNEEEGAAEAGARIVREQHGHSRSRQSFGRGHGGRRREHDIVEEEEEEVVDDGPGVRYSGTSGASLRSAGTTGGGPNSLLKNLRVKVHYPEETRFIILPPDPSFHDFTNQIVRKFSGNMAGKGMKIKTKDDDDDMITLGDQDDLEPCLQSARRKAKTQGTDLGKLEVSC